MSCYNSTVEISELGEFGLIERIKNLILDSEDRQAESWQQLILGIGDDAAAWKNEAASIELGTVDSLVEGVHFPPGNGTWEDIGWRALAVNLSDIAAMGGWARYALAALSLPSNLEVENITGLYRGMIELANKFGVVIAGGNITSAPILTITVTVLGKLRIDNKMLTRSSARPGDKIGVTGYLGSGAAGLEMIKKRLRFDPGIEAQLKNWFFRPEPRLVEGEILVKSGVRTGMDISDGLVADLGHICKESGVGAYLEARRLPVNSLVKTAFSDRWLDLALAGGDDYELLFTAEPEIFDKLKLTIPVTQIGEVVKDFSDVRIMGEDGRLFSIKKGGWEHLTQDFV